MRGCDPAFEKVKPSTVGSRGRLLVEAAAPLGGAAALVVAGRKGPGGAHGRGPWPHLRSGKVPPAQTFSVTAPVLLLSGCEPLPGDFHLAQPSPASLSAGQTQGSHSSSLKTLVLRLPPLSPDPLTM